MVSGGPDALCGMPACRQPQIIPTRGLSRPGAVVQPQPCGTLIQPYPSASSTKGMFLPIFHRKQKHEDTHECW